MEMIRKLGLWLALVVVLSAGLVPDTTRPVLAAEIAEVEDNGNAGKAQALAAIGLTNPVRAQINQPGDNDWYSFQAVVAQTYVVEIYEAESALNSAGGGNCEAWSGYRGLAIQVLGSAQTQKALQCYPAGSGNTHNVLSFQADASSTFYIRVLPNSSAASVVGSYKLRILPKHGEQGAAWDNATQEPNNQPANAYEIRPGMANALTSSIEERNVAFATSFVDVDWYRFEAVAGRSYAIELFNVGSALSRVGGSNCESYSGYTGLAMIIYDGAVVEQTRRCSPFGAGNMHTSIAIKSRTTGPIYIRIFPNANTTTVFGQYSLRVLPKHDELQGASWESSSYEPNNHAINAYPIQVGRNSALLSNIEAPDSAFSTNFTDIDWYRFEAVAEQRYVIDLFNVASSLAAAGGANCEAYSGYRGLALLVFGPDAGDLNIPSNAISGQCRGNGYGNVHSTAEFTAKASGWFYIQVYAHNSTVSGNYGLRVLPKYDQPGASWDVALEPNNRWTTAYPLALNNCTRTGIDPRNASFATINNDLDHFVINPVKDSQYRLELDEIASTFGRAGLTIELYDLEGNRIGIQRTADKATINFKAGYTGPHYISVYPNEQKNGTYRIRFASDFAEGCEGEPPSVAVIDGPGSTGTDPGGRITVLMPPSNNTTSITILAICTVNVNVTPQQVTLQIGSRTFAMQSVGESRYRATLNTPGDLPDGRGPFEMSARFSCSGEVQVVNIGIFIFFDPSGIISDATTGAPIKGAVVSLYRVPGALPDTDGQTRDCRTIKTRGGNDWSGLPPANLNAGALINPLLDALNSTQQISPTINPQITGSNGSYAWDVVEGCWFVRVEATGYAPAISPVVGVPEAVTDLHIKLQAVAQTGERRVYLPLVVR